MAGWGKLVAGVVIGAAGALYATNRKARERLPQAARDLPDTVRDRFENAVAAAREAAAERRAEIERGLEHHGGGDHTSRGVRLNTSGEETQPIPNPTDKANESS